MRCSRGGGDNRGEECSSGGRDNRGRGGGGVWWWWGLDWDAGRLARVVGCGPAPVSCWYRLLLLLLLQYTSPMAGHKPLYQEHQSMILMQLEPDVNTARSSSSISAAEIKVTSSRNNTGGVSVVCRTAGVTSAAHSSSDTKILGQSSTGEGVRKMEDRMTKNKYMWSMVSAGQQEQ